MNTRDYGNPDDPVYIEASPSEPTLEERKPEPSGDKILNGLEPLGGERHLTREEQLGMERALRASGRPITGEEGK